MKADRESDSSQPRTTRSALNLRPYQQQNLDLLTKHGRYAVWDEAGLGKTRPLLAASRGRTVVIAPAAVRDTRGWEREAERIGIEPPTVISYHQAAKAIPPRDTLILDEAHRVKNRKVSWADAIYAAAHSTERVFEATGTPMPNAAFELWGQLRMLRPRDERMMKHYWPWVSEWFQPAPTRHSSYNMSDRLLMCYCPATTDGQPTTCEHWQRFHAANIEGYAVRHLRDEVLTDLPPISGHDYPLVAPMTKAQRAMYAQLKKDFLLTVPDTGLALEALNDSSKFTMMHQLSSGLSVLDPASDPKHKESGKLVWLRDFLPDRRRPLLIVCWFRNSARALADLCADLKIGIRLMGSNTTAGERAELVRSFERGDVPVLIASLPVVKEGVDGLQYGSDEVVLFERSWTPGDNEQTIRRLHRLGQTRPVTARQLVTERSVDSEQWDMLNDKGSHINRVLRPAEIASLLG